MGAETSSPGVHGDSLHNIPASFNMESTAGRTFEGDRSLFLCAVLLLSLGWTGSRTFFFILITFAFRLMGRTMVATHYQKHSILVLRPK